MHNTVNAIATTKPVTHRLTRVSGGCATLWSIVGLAWLALLVPPAAGQEALWELRPYAVRIVLIPDESQAWSDDQLRHEVSALQRSISAHVGPLWDATIVLADDSLRSGVSPSAAIDWKNPQVLEQLNKAVDKLLLVNLSHQAGQLTIRSQCYDQYLQRSLPSVVHHGPLRQQFSQQLCRAVFDSFGFLGLVSAAESDTATVRIRGGQLPLRNSKLTCFPSGSTLRFMRRRPGPATPSAADAVYAVVEQREAHTCRCVVYGRTALDVPIESSQDNAWCVVQLPSSHRYTTITCQTLDGQPLVGLEVTLADTGRDAVRPLGRTDDRGQLKVPRSDRLGWLRLGFDSVVLAQVPLLAGSESEVDLPLGIDESTLASAEALADVRRQLRELSAYRQLVLARCDVLQQAGQTGPADQQRRQLQAMLETRTAELTSQLNSITVADETLQTLILQTSTQLQDLKERP